MPSAKDLLRQYAAIKESRRSFDQHYEDLAGVMAPGRLGFTSGQTEGERRGDERFDGTPMQAARGLANATGGLLRPEGQQWFFIETDDRIEENDKQAKDWLAAAERRQMAAMDNPKARFRQATGEADFNAVVFGSADIFVGERADLGGLLYQAQHLKDTWVRLDDDGQPEAHFRRRWLTAPQAAAKLGEANIGERARDLLQRNDVETRLEYAHIVLRRDDGREDTRFARNFPWGSWWFEVASQAQVAEGGFREFPFVFFRWDTTSGETYGRGPGMIALPDSLTLQAVGETLLESGQRAADPPLFVPDDGAFNAANTFPGGLTYYDVELAKSLGRIPVAPMDVGTNLPIGRDIQRDLREQVFAAFFRNVLNLPVDGPQMTATEVIERKEEFIREVGAVFGRLESDYTAPLVERTFGIMLRAGAFGPVPESLQGRAIRFRYASPVKRVRQEVEATAIRLTLEEALMLSQARPEILDNFDVDAIAQFWVEARNLPDGIAVDREQVAAIRGQRQQETQAMQMADLVERGAGVANLLGGAA